MAATRCSWNSMVGGLALVLWVLTQSSLCSADVSTHAELEIRATAPKFSAFSFPTVRRFSLPPIPQFQVPQIPHFVLSPLRSHLTLPCLNTPQLSLPPLAVSGLHLPPLPQPTLPVARLPGLQLPFTAVFPPLSSFLIPKISIPSLSARTSTVPNMNPADLTVPGLTIPSNISPLPTVTLPPPVVFPKFGGFPRRVAPGALEQRRP